MRGGVELHGSGCKIPVEGEGEILWHKSSGSRTGIECESIRYRQRESGPFRDYLLALRSSASVGSVYMIGHQRMGGYLSEKPDDFLNQRIFEAWQTQFVGASV